MRNCLQPRDIWVCDTIDLRWLRRTSSLLPKQHKSFLVVVASAVSPLASRGDCRNADNNKQTKAAKYTNNKRQQAYDQEIRRGENIIANGNAAVGLPSLPSLRVPATALVVLIMPTSGNRHQRDVKEVLSLCRKLKSLPKVAWPG